MKTVLNISANNFSAKAAEILASGLEKSSLLSFSLVATQLDSHDRTIGTEGANHFASYLKKNPSLQSFCLKQNDVTNEGLFAILDGLRFNTHLKELDLSSNPFDSHCAPALSHFLKHTTTLRLLSLNDIARLGDTGIRELAQGIASNSSLKILSLKSCSIASVGGRHLSSALSHNSSIEKLYLSGNYGWGSGATDILCRVLKANSQVRTLHLSNCGIGDEGAVYMADLLRINTTLLDVSLKQNEITDAGGIHLAGAIANNR